MSKMRPIKNYTKKRIRLKWWHCPYCGSGYTFYHEKRDVFYCGSCGIFFHAFKKEEDTEEGGGTNL